MFIVKIIVFLLSLILPVHAIGLSILGGIRRNGGLLSVLSFALAFAVISYTLVPPESYDLYRHYARIDSLKGLPFSEVFASAESGYVVFHIYAWLISLVGLPKEFFTASIVFISSLLFFLVYLDLKNKHLAGMSGQFRLMAFTVFWLSVGFIMIASGIRNGFANSVVFYIGYQFIFYNRNILFLVGSLFSFFIHPFAALPVFLLVLSKLFKRFSRHAKFLVLAGTVLMLSPTFSSYVISGVSDFFEFLPFYKPHYFRADSEWGGGFHATRSTAGLIVSYGIKRLSFYVALIYLLFHSPKSRDGLYFLLCLMVFIIGITFHLYAFSGRVISIFVHFFGVYLIITYLNRHGKYARVYIIGFISALAFHSLFHIYEYSEFLFGSIDWIYKPLPFILIGN